MSDVAWGRDRRAPRPAGRSVSFPAAAGLLAGLALACAGPGAPPPAAEEGSIHIPFERYVLDNGLTLIVHQDRKAPIVAVNVWYHVGSKNEKPGKTGFAHLFEHLMFNGSENHDDDYFAPFDRVGATDMNGTTDSDRTNYFQNVPTSALDLPLFLESDRMGHLLGAIDQDKLDEQRGVVQNEKRQRENQPYGRVFELLTENAYPEGHPYSWSTIGSMEDLDAASLEDVREWFETYYGAANAVIVVAGDVDPEDARREVERYFGDIPPGPPVDRYETWIAAHEGEHRLAIEDRVPQARIVKAWNVPPIGSADGDYLDLASTLMSEGKTSRLYQRLVYEEQIATDVAAFVWLREISGLFVVWATAKPGQDLAEVEAVLDEELARFLAEGPTEQELARVKTQHRASFVRGIERIGGFGGKSDILARSEIYGESPDAYRAGLARQAAATVEDLRETARSWLSDGSTVIEVHPFPDYAAQGEGIDRSSLPEPGPPPEVRFPDLGRATLSNGLDVIVAERHAVPVVAVELLVDAGYAADSLGLPGTAKLAMNMLDEGTAQRSALEISEELAGLGAQLSAGSDLDVSTVSLSALRENLAASLDVFADVVLEPVFDPGELERLRAQQLAAIQREKVTPQTMGLRVLPKLIYGEDHAYGIPFTGSGDEASVASITRADLVRFHETWFVPGNATLVVVGDTSLEEIVPLLEARFGSWSGPAPPPKNLARVEPWDGTRVFVVDRPGSVQSIVLGGQLAPPKRNDDEIAFEAVNQVLGGSFSARINMNLREDKHWAYGAFSFVRDARGQRPFVVYAPVQSDKTVPALAELQRELLEISGGQPPTAEELARAKDKETLTLPGRWETAGAVADTVAQMVRFGFPDDYWIRYPRRMRALELPEVARVARERIQPERVTWVVVGDRTLFEAELRALGLGPLSFIDADGNPIPGTASEGTP